VNAQVGRVRPFKSCWLIRERNCYQLGIGGRKS